MHRLARSAGRILMKVRRISCAPLMSAAISMFARGRAGASHPACPNLAGALGSFPLAPVIRAVCPAVPRQQKLWSGVPAD